MLYHLVRWPFVSGKVKAIGVAVSGGGDSMALLDLMQHWAFGARVRIEAVTVDHGLREEAVQEAAMVAEFCETRRIPHETLHWSWDGQGNLQNAAREGRYGLIAGWARARGLDAVCLGHTKDDQAETFLMRLARQSGSDGLRGMMQRVEREGMTFVRPLLQVTRAELRGFLARKGIPYVDDPSNDDSRYDRVKARQVLAALAPLGIDAEVLSAVAHNLHMENAFLRCATRAELDGQGQIDRGALSMTLREFRFHQVEVQRRMLTAVITWIGGKPPRATALPPFEMGLGLGGDMARPRTLGGVIAWQAQSRVWFAREYEAARRAPPAQKGEPWDGRWIVTGGPEGCEVRALGPEGLKQLAGWRDLGVPRRVLLPTPGLWRGDWLVAAPLAGQTNGSEARLIVADYREHLDTH
nr:tRNA lysidine(34) synthetase TilS [Mesobacterium pallidum]